MWPQTRKLARKIIPPPVLWSSPTVELALEDTRNRQSARSCEAPALGSAWNSYPAIGLHLSNFPTARGDPTCASAAFGGAPGGRARTIAGLPGENRLAA